MMGKSKTKKLVIFGTADQAEVACYLFRYDSHYEPAAFTVDGDYIRDEMFNGLPVIPFEEVEQVCPPSDYIMFIALGYNQMNKVRTVKYMESKTKGYALASYISSSAIIWPDFICGENCLILEQNNIQPFVKIGNNVTMWSGNHIGHHSSIGDNTFLTSHVVVSGRVSVGRNCFLGVNSTIRDKLTIADDCLISAGSLVTKNTDPFGVYMGSPARRLEKTSGAVTI